VINGQLLQTAGCESKGGCRRFGWERHVSREEGREGVVCEHSWKGGLGADLALIHSNLCWWTDSSGVHETNDEPDEALSPSQPRNLGVLTASRVFGDDVKSGSVTLNMARNLEYGCGAGPLHLAGS
jgi:hypothetical protein